MKSEIAYAFPTAPLASKFIAELRAGAVGDCQCRRHDDDTQVLVIYRLDETEGYTSKAQALDDLAESLEGCEITG